MENYSKKRISAKKVIITSFIVDFLDIALSVFIAVISGSVIMLTQVLEGVSDLAASGILFLGLSRSLKKEDKTHPFGYGREIYFWALISALITFGATATISIYFGFERFINPRPVHNIWLAFAVLAITMVTNGYAFFLSFKRLLRRKHLKHIIQIFYKSSLIETKTTFILDFMGTIASFLGLVALFIYMFTGDYRYDGLGAMIIGITVGVGAVFLIIGIRDLLVGRSASVEVEAKIKNAAMNVSEVKEILNIKTVHVGPEKLLVALDVHMQARLTTRELEKLIDKIKMEIRREVPNVKYIQVELETPVKI